jgi:hypothetical protein
MRKDFFWERSPDEEQKPYPGIGRASKMKQKKVHPARVNKNFGACPKPILTGMSEKRDR